MKNIIQLIVLILVVAIFAVGGFWYWQHNKYYPSTDNAYVQAHVSHITAQVDGPVESVSVRNHEMVEKDQLLFTIQQRPFQIAVQQAQAQLDLATQKVASEKAAVNVAKAQLDQAKAKQIQAKKQAERILSLVKQGHVSQSAADQAQEDLQVSTAGVESAQNSLDQAVAQLGNSGDNNAEIQSAKANLAQAKLNLEHTQVFAPVAGKTVNLTLNPGDMVSAQQPVFSVIEPHEWWVNANYKETQLARIKPGQTATITLDMYPKHLFKGKVDSISSGSGAAFSLLPPENATGNWVKVTQRFPVKVVITDTDKDYPLRVGASAKVTINTK